MTSTHKLIIMLMTAASVTAYCFLDIQLNFQAGIEGSIRSTNTVTADQRAAESRLQANQPPTNNGNAYANRP